MAVAGILTSNIFNLINQVTGHNSGHNKFQQLKQGFQQLSQDLQSGNLSQAQSDVDALQQYLPSGQQGTPATQSIAGENSKPLASALTQLSQDLQSGNLSAAKSDFATVQQDVQQIAQQPGAGHAHHHHHPSAGANSTQSSSQQQAVATLFSQLGQSLQSGNLTAAQQAYSTLQQDLQQFAVGGSSTSSGVSSTGSSSSANLNVTA